MANQKNLGSYLVQVGYVPSPVRQFKDIFRKNYTHLYEREISKGETIRFGRGKECQLNTSNWNREANGYLSSNQAVLSFLEKGQMGFPGILFKNVGQDIPFLVSEPEIVGSFFPEYSADNITVYTGGRGARLKANEDTRILAGEGVVFINSGLVIKLTENK